MGVLIQIRDVPEDVHQELKVRAAEEGVSLSEFVRRLLVAETSRISHAELMARLEALPVSEGGPSGAEIIREIRDEYE